VFACTKIFINKNQEMMFRIVWQWLLMIGLNLWPLAGLAAPRAEHVFIISIDGGKPEVIKQVPMPELMKLVKEGAYTWQAETIKPSLTLPSHTSMLTGVPMEKHGITWNSWVATNGIIKIPTIFTAAKLAGISTAMFVGKEKFRHLLREGTVDKFDYDRSNSVMVIKSDSGGPDRKKEGSRDW